MVKVALSVPNKMVASSPLDSNRWSSPSARLGSTTRWPWPSTLVTARSRTARRYESVATRRRPSGSAAINTPVSARRCMSVLAARTTWRSASANNGAEMVTGGADARVTLGKSVAAKVDTVVWNRPEVTTTSSFWVSMITLPSGVERTMSLRSFALATTTPSPCPPTVSTNCTERSLSVHVIVSSSPVSDSRTPESAGMALLRVDATRAHAPRASAKTSRSTRNFMGTTSLVVHCCLWMDKEISSNGNKCCGLWVSHSIP